MAFTYINILLREHKLLLLYILTFHLIKLSCMTAEIRSVQVRVRLIPLPHTHMMKSQTLHVEKNIIHINI